MVFLEYTIFFFSGGVVIYFDRIEVVNQLHADSGKYTPFSSAYQHFA